MVQMRNYKLNLNKHELRLFYSLIISSSGREGAREIDLCFMTSQSIPIPQGILNVLQMNIQQNVCTRGNVREF